MTALGMVDMLCSLACCAGDSEALRLEVLQYMASHPQVIGGAPIEG